MRALFQVLIEKAEPTFRVACRTGNVEWKAFSGGGEGKEPLFVSLMKIRR
ncbi:hypothetical protein [Vibrio kanaloae]|nr:hypothetical protein [Vibrio kanaloae]